MFIKSVELLYTWHSIHNVSTGSTMLKVKAQSWLQNEVPDPNAQLLILHMDGSMLCQYH